MSQDSKEKIRIVGPIQLFEVEYKDGYIILRTTQSDNLEYEREYKIEGTKALFTTRLPYEDYYW